MAADAVSRPHARTFAAALLVCAGCYVGASFASWARFPGVGTAILFPPYAILAAALLRAPPRRWWILAAGQLHGEHLGAREC